jgi:hypothetical protein
MAGSGLRKSRRAKLSTVLEDQKIAVCGSSHRVNKKPIGERPQAAIFFGYPQVFLSPRA